MDHPVLDHPALQRCFRYLGHLFIEFSRLKEEREYEARGGGYGDVHIYTLDSETLQSKLVAVKTIRLRARNRKPIRLVFRLARELKVWARLQHPHVLPVLGYYLDNSYKIAALISEYQPRGDLNDFLAQESPSWDMRVRLIRDLTDGLAYLHGQDPPIRHGDLKPGNVLIGVELQAMLADFGLAQTLEDGPTGLTTSTGPRGTVRYYSPELLGENAHPDLSSDIWAWACLAFEVLARKIPYATRILDAAVILALARGELPSENDNLPIYVPDLQLLLLKCWITEPTERPTALHCLSILGSICPVSDTDAIDQRTTLQYVSPYQDSISTSASTRLEHRRNETPSQSNAGDPEGSVIAQLEIATEGLPSPPRISSNKSVTLERNSTDLGRNASIEQSSLGSRHTFASPSLPPMRGESAVIGQIIRNLGLTPSTPRNSDGEDSVLIQRSTHQKTAQPSLPHLTSHYIARPAQDQPPHPVHSAASSSISTSPNSQHGFQHSNGSRQAGAQSPPTPGYANAGPLNYVGSRSGLRSSPAMDTTPRQTTPSHNFPPESFAGGITEDRSLDNLGLDVGAEMDYPASSFNQSRPHVRNDMYVDHSQNPPQTRPAVNPSPASTSAKVDRREPIDKQYIMVTADAENHVFVDITGAKDAASITERMFLKLRIANDDQKNYQIYRTEVGEAALGDPFTADQLLIYCRAWADAIGTLRFLVQRQPPNPNVAAERDYPASSALNQSQPDAQSGMSEWTVTGRRIRKLGLSVFGPDNSSDDDVVPIQRNTPQTTAQLRPKPLPVPGVAQGSYFPQHSPLQQLQSPYTACPAQRQASHPIHSASSSTSSISISTPLNSQPSFQLPNGARQAGVQSPPTAGYANAGLLNYVGLRSGPKSSPAMDTTTRQTTPSHNFPPVNFAGGVTDDRNLGGLGLEVAAETDYPASSFNQSRPHARNDMYTDHSQNPPQTRPAVNPSPALTSAKIDRREPVDKLVITVTADADNHSIVDITGAKDAAFIRERMFSKLRIPYDDHENYQIYRTEFGEAALGDPVTDDQLMIYCEAWADAKGTLKFLVQRNPTAPPPQPQFAPVTQQTPTTHVQTPPAIPNPTPPLFSPAYDRRRADNTAGGLHSADWERAPWGMLNGYDGDVDNRRRHQSPPPIDTRRRREPSASGSDLSSFSPTSPSGPPANMTPLIAMPSRRPQPSQLSSVSAAGAYLNQNTPVAHRRRESDTAVMEREQAFEAQERIREQPKQEWDSKYNKGRAERDRQSRRQQQVHSSDGPTPSGHKAHWSESADSSAPHGWVLVNEVFPTPTSATAPERFGMNQRTPSSYGRSNTTPGVSEWAGTPPSEGALFSPATATTPSTSRPYSHATNTCYTATTPTLQRAHPPLPGTGRYPNPHPPSRSAHGSHAPLPPGAVDPRMRQMEKQQPPAPPPNQFYSPSIAGTYNPPPAGYIPPQQSTPPSSRMLQPSGNTSGAETTGGARGLRSPRSMSDLNQRNALNAPGPPPTSQSSNQIPTLARKPGVLPTNSLLSDSLYNGPRQPTSPNRLPPSPSRPITNPTWLYSGTPGGSARTPATPQDYGNGLPRSLGNGASLFNSGVFADRPLNRNPALRANPSTDRLNAVERNMANQAQPQGRDQGPPVQASPLPTPGTSSSYRYGWLSNTSSPAASRPNSGDVDNGDFNRPSPIEQSANEALSMLETRRPSLPAVNVASTPLEPTERLASPWHEKPLPTTGIQGIQIPKAVATPSSPIDPSTATIGVQLYDNPGPFSATATSPALSSMSSTEFTDDGSEGTLKPGDRERLLSMAGSDNDADEEETGTLKPKANRVSFAQVVIPAVITAKAKRVSMTPARAKSVRRGGPLQPDAGEGEQPNGEEEEEEYYDSDSSEEDKRFWNTSSAPSATATPPVIKTGGPDEEANSTLGPLNRSRGPSLTVMVSPLVDDRGSPMPTPSTAGTNLPTSRENSPSPSPSPASGLTPTSGIPPPSSRMLQLSGNTSGAETTGGARGLCSPRSMSDLNKRNAPNAPVPIGKLIVSVTADAENYVVADITGAKDAAFIRERMFSKLRIPGDDHENYQIYRTELGEAAFGDPVTDDQLVIYCEAWADAKGTLKFLVQRNPTAPPPQPQFVPVTQQTPTTHVPTPPTIPNPTPPLLSPVYDRQGADNTVGGLPSTDWQRAPWDVSNGDDGDGLQ